MTAKGHSHLGRYWAVYVGLMILTGATVFVSNLHMALAGAVMVALAIAILKGGLVAGYFMHLVGEHKAIFWVLALTLFLLVFMLLVPTLVMWGDYRV
jgi:cytochrome c oxidase subunit 4